MITRHSRKIERAVRRGVKTEIRKSVALKREYRRVRKSVVNQDMGLIKVVGLGVLLPILVFLVGSTEHLRTELAAINVWVLAWAFLQVNTVASALFQSKDTNALFFLPVSDAFIFHWNTRNFFKRSAVAYLLPLLLGYWACAGRLGSWPAVGLAVIAAVLSWASMAALTLLFVTRLRWLPIPIINLAIIAFPIVLIFGQRAVGAPALQLLDEHAQSMNILLPSGWIPAVFEAAVAKHSSLSWGLLVPAIALIASMKSSLRYLQSFYVIREEERAEAADILPAEIAEEGAMSDEPRAPRRLGKTAIEEIVLSGQTLRGLQSLGNGAVEQMIWRAMSERERRLAEFIFPTGFAATQRWMKVLRNFAICAAIAVALKLAGAEFSGLVVMGGVVITGMQCLSLSGTSGRAFMFSLSGGLRAPMHALFGVGYHEVGRLLMKVTLVQLPLSVAWCFSMGALMTYIFDWAAMTAFAIALKVPLMFLAIRLGLLVIGFSSQSNDTILRWRSIVMILPLVGLVPMIGGLGIVSFATSGWLAAAASFGTVLFAYGFYRVYGFWYNRNGFDLLTVQQA